MAEAGFSFQVSSTQGQARAGEITTPNGRVATPAFMSVATQATVKGLAPDEVVSLGAEMVLCNAYHLYLRPGVDVVAGMGGLHRFMGWSRPILTDSGGFQAFSMGALRKVDDSGIQFRSHIDGSAHRLSPQVAMDIQRRLGADIIMCLDQCIAFGAPKEQVSQAMERTHRWAAACHQDHLSSGASQRQALFGIVQGGSFADLRDESTGYISGIPFDGYAIGGLAVGESKERMYQVVEQVTGRLPQDKPRYLMGVGSPEDLVEGVARGVDMFDCVLPTRVARNGALFTRQGRVDITKRQFAEQGEPVDQGCDCYTCQNFSAGYLRHLFRAKELLAPRLASIHNLRFIMRLMADMRRAILEGRFQEFRQEFLGSYQPTNEIARQQQKEKWLQARGG
ncbi:MAG: tRNA guanosine(34) transglycosylase Tgt [Chloroflexi bacterium]|nr:tRNA guanosine(34) transglycosylase Tgt [Chloroflexota bacterium]